MFDEFIKILSQPYFSWVKKLLEAHPDAEIFLVGGAVRDAALGRASKDYDFVVRGLQSRKLQEFLGSVGIVNLVGRTFGVYKFIPEDGYDEFKAAGFEALDIALPRTEHAWGTGGYRDVEVQSDHELPIEKDLSRRDFTINSIALKLALHVTGYTLHEMVDPFGGMDDIKAKVIRAVGDPKERFEEDYTRILRGLRFACELGFAVEPSTMAALKVVMPRINDKRANVDQPVMSPLSEFVAPREVVSRELTRAFYANPVAAFDFYDTSGAFEILIPELIKMKGCPQPEEFHSEGDVWTHTRLALKSLKTPEYQKTFGDSDPYYSALLVMAVLFHDIGKPPMLKTPENDGVDPAPFPNMTWNDGEQVGEAASRLISNAKKRQTEEKGGVSRISFDEHDTVGAGLADEIARRLVLAIMGAGPLHVDYDRLGWLIHHHLFLLQTDAEDFKASTVEKYFFNPKNPGEELLRLAFCDCSAAIPKGGAPELSNLERMIARIARVRAAVQSKQITPKSFLSGDEIMKMLNIPAGPGIGEIKNALIEEQLSARITTKDAAMDWLNRTYG